MNGKILRRMRTLQMLPAMVIAWALSAVGKPEQAMQFIGRGINAPRVKARAFARYQPTKKDIFVATFSKSGTNWMMQIAQQIAYFGFAEFEHIHDLVPWPDAPFPQINAFLDDDTIAERAPTNLRVIKTHYERDFVPFNRHAKYIIVIRNPKEVAVSGYHFAKGFFGAVGIEYDVSMWVENFLRPESALFGDWAAHTASWWAMRHEPNVKTLTYTELKRNSAEVIPELAQFLGVQLSSEQLDSVLERSSFSWMKAHEPQFKPPMPPQRGKRTMPAMIRAGNAGKSNELLTAEQQTAIDDFYRARLRQLGSDFPYDDAFR